MGNKLRLEDLKLGDRILLDMGPQMGTVNCMVVKADGESILVMLNDSKTGWQRDPWCAIYGNDKSFWWIDYGEDRYYDIIERLPRAYNDLRKLIHKNEEE